MAKAKRESKKEYWQEYEHLGFLPEVTYAIGWETEFLGHGSHFSKDGQVFVAVYDRTAMVERLATEAMDECTEDECLTECDHHGEADEYISFNVEGAYMGPGMPVYLSFAEKEDEFLREF